MIKSNTSMNANTVVVSIGGKDVFSVNNTTCNAGLNKILERLTDTSNTSGLAVLSKLAYGTGSTAQTVDDTALETETGRVDIIESEYVLSGNTLKVYARLPVYGEITIRELGLFMGELADALLARTTLPVDVVKPDGEAMTIEWTLNLNNS